MMTVIMTLMRVAAVVLSIFVGATIAYGGLDRDISVPAAMLCLMFGVVGLSALNDLLGPR